MAATNDKSDSDTSLRIIDDLLRDLKHELGSMAKLRKEVVERGICLCNGTEYGRKTTRRPAWLQGARGEQGNRQEVRVCAQVPDRSVTLQWDLTEARNGLYVGLLPKPAHQTHERITWSQRDTLHHP